MIRANSAIENWNRALPVSDRDYNYKLQSSRDSVKSMTTIAKKSQMLILNIIKVVSTSHTNSDELHFIYCLSWWVSWVRFKTNVVFLPFFFFSLVSAQFYVHIYILRVCLCVVLFFFFIFVSVILFIRTIFAFVLSL